MALAHLRVMIRLAAPRCVFIIFIAGRRNPLGGMQYGGLELTVSENLKLPTTLTPLPPIHLKAQLSLNYKPYL